jgi:hypothetical protein
VSKISELSDGGSLVSSDYLIAVRSGGNVKVRMDQINVDQVDLGDNEFIRLGNSQDLTMVHTSTQSIINQAGIGDLLIQKAGATKLTINSSGIDVTGTVTADGLTVDTSATGGFKVEDRGAEGAGVKVTAYQGTTNSNVRQLDVDAYQLTVSTGSVTGATVTDRLLIADNGDISFYEDTGTTPKFFWDASAEALRVGSTAAIFTNSVISGVSALGPTIGAKQTVAAQGAGGFWNSDAGTVNLVDFYAGAGGTQVGSIKGSSTGVSLFGTGGTGLTVYGASGNVGIGTTLPSAPLNISATYASDTTEQFRIQDNTGGALDFYGYANATRAIQALDSTNDAPKDLMLNPLGGNVGIGTSSPATFGALAVYGNGTPKTLAIIEGTNTNANNDIYGSLAFGGRTDGTITAKVSGLAGNNTNGTDGQLAFYTADNTAGAGPLTEHMRIDSSGNVGIGTDSPSQKLHVYQSATDSQSYVTVQNNRSRNAAVLTQTTNGGFYTGTSVGTDTLCWQVYDASAGERMRIDASGNLLVGTTTSLGRITANGADGVAAISTTVATSINYAAASFTNSAGTQVGRIVANDAGTTQYITSSDQRLKENIADADEAGVKIDAIQVRKFDWKSDGSHQDFGMIAQELQAVAPEAVAGDPESEEVMGVDYSKLVPMMLKEIQSLRARIAALES